MIKQKDNDSRKEETYRQNHLISNYKYPNWILIDVVDKWFN